MARSEDFSAASGAARGEQPAVAPVRPAAKSPRARATESRTAELEAEYNARPAPAAPVASPSSPVRPYVDATEARKAVLGQLDVNERAQRPAPVAPTRRPTRAEVAASIPSAGKQLRNEGGGDTTGQRRISLVERQARAAAKRQARPIVPLPTGTPKDANKILADVNTHRQILQAKVTSLMGDYGSHPDAGASVKEAQEHLDTAEAHHFQANKIIKEANYEDRGRGSEAGKDAATPFLAKATASLLAAHDVLANSPTLHEVTGDDHMGNSNAHPGISRAELENNDAHARRNVSDSTVGRRPAALPNRAAFGGIEIFPQTEEGKAVMDAAGDVGDQEVLRRDKAKATTATPRPARPSERVDNPMDTMEHVDADSGRPASGWEVEEAKKTVDPKKIVRTTESFASIPKSSLAGEGDAPEEKAGSKFGAPIGAPRPRVNPNQIRPEGPLDSDNRFGSKPFESRATTPSTLVTVNPVTKQTHTHKIGAVRKEDIPKPPKKGKPAPLSNKDKALKNPAIAAAAAKLIARQGRRK